MVVTLYVINNTTTPGHRYPHNPAVGPAIQVFKPDNTEFLASTTMPQVETGIFTYVIHTESNSPIGPYSGIFTASNDIVEMISRKYHLFTILP